MRFFAMLNGTLRGRAMKVGVLSDTHDNRESADQALRLFVGEGVEAILHLGDVCSPHTLASLCASGIPLVGVFGNNDEDRRGLQAATGSAFHAGPHMPVVGGRRVLMAHSFDGLQDAIGEGGRFELILFGHTHRPLRMRVGRALVLNPGEACGFVSGRSTCALVDLASMEARIVDLGAQGAVADEPPRGAAGRTPGR